MNAPVLSRIEGRPDVSHAEMANAIRFLAIDAVEKAKSGHPGMPMGMADVATVLFSRFLKFDPADPAWPDRDRFVLSAGHGSMLLYALLHLTGYEGVTSDELKAFRQWGSKTPGHPEYGHTPGVETTTGPLGQGIATAVGMALAERLMNARFGDDCVDHFTYVIAGDGCLMEGLSHEAISLAGHLRLNRLIVLFDDNEISIDGATSLSCSDDQLARFKASGWSACRIDGHDPEAIAAAIERARNDDRPSLIACRTRDRFRGAEPPGQRKSAWRAARRRGGRKNPRCAELAAPAVSDPGGRPRAMAQGRCARACRPPKLDRADEANSIPPSGRRFTMRSNRNLPCGYVDAMARLRDRFGTERPNIATRQASQLVIDGIAEALPNLLGGSADLTHSNLTRAKTQQPVRPGCLEGSYIHYGVREHAMAAAMNGIALHGGFIPYGGTFLSFADYSRPAIRLAALMRHTRHPCDDARFHRIGRGWSHPSAGRASGIVAGDPQSAGVSGRAMPSRPPRPGTARCGRKITRRCCACRGRRCRRSAKPAASRTWSRSALTSWSIRRSGRDVTLIATGSEVSIAMHAAELLASVNVRAAVVSAPCFELFRQQSREYRTAVLGRVPRIGVEAAVEGDWARWLGDDGEFVGMTGFGASAPAETLYREFGITADAVAKAALRCIARARMAANNA